MHQWNFPYFSVTCAVETQILNLNFSQFEREFNSTSPPFPLLLWPRIFYKRNFHFLKAKLVCTNEIFLIFQLLVQLRPIFSISICDSLKENSILHLLLFLFYSQHEFFIRKILILWKMNSSARMKFSLFLSFLCSWDPNSQSQFLTVWKRIQFYISSFPSSTLTTNFLQEKFSFSQSWTRLHEWNFPYFSVTCAVETPILDLNLLQFEREFNSTSPPFLLLLSRRIFCKKNLHFRKAEFVSFNSIFDIFQFLVRLRHKFLTSICNTLKEN